MKVTIRSEYGWKITKTYKTLLAAKQAATRALTFADGDVELKTPEGTFVRKYWESRWDFGWGRWVRVG